MSPGWSIAIASCAVTTAAVRSTTLRPRASISSLRDLSMELSGQNPCAQLLRSAARSGAMDRLNARPWMSSDGSKMAWTLSPSMTSAP
jgi:hypothetical protein